MHLQDFHRIFRIFLLPNDRIFSGFSEIYRIFLYHFLRIFQVFRIFSLISGFFFYQLTGFSCVGQDSLFTTQDSVKLTGFSNICYISQDFGVKKQDSLTFTQDFVQDFLWDFLQDFLQDFLHRIFLSLQDFLLRIFRKNN